MKISEMISILTKVYQDFGKDIEISDICLEDGKLEILLDEAIPVDKIPNMIINDKTGIMN